MHDGSTPSRFSREQKTGVVVLLVFSLLTIGLGGLQLRNTIYGPFVIRASDTPVPAIVLDENAKLQQIDTDHDGLNDYEELHFYSTSPYLADTDSDGISDKTEIDRGTDPLCPQGKPCTILEENVASSSTVFGADQTFGVDESAQNPLDAFAASLSTIGATSTGAIRREVIRDPAALRDMLLKSGALTADQLSVIDDATLLQLASESAAATVKQ